MKNGFCKHLLGQLWPLVFVLMAPSALAKHLAPPKVEPVVHKGIRYVLPNDKGRRAYVEAWDVQSGRKLWARTIFRHWYVPLPFGPTECMYYEYVTSMDLVADQLVFTSERGRQYGLDLQKKSIRGIRADKTLTHRVPDAYVAFVCGGSLSAEQVAELTRAATTTEYSWARSWVEQRCPTSEVPVSQRVFVIQDSRPRKAFILLHRDGLTVGEALLEVGVEARSVSLLREDGPRISQKLTTPDAACEIQRLDVVVIARTTE